MKWRYFEIGPSYFGAKKFYAENLEQAFHLARMQFGSVTLICYGSEK